jgi:ring-1,2-phenylacetyl-CoA epoxidase subunit PaaD
VKTTPSQCLSLLPNQQPIQQPATYQQVLAILSAVVDPEIPVLTIEDLGILRSVAWSDDAQQWIISITPTYSGCPATDLISTQIRLALLEHGIRNFSIRQVLSPAWTTDWMTEAGKEKLRQYGIAPPVGKAIDEALLENTIVPCPRCGSTHTKLVSAFSSTACKAFYECQDCLEPFDHFKCH